MRPDWDQYFLGIAQAVAERTDCRRSKVGAVIVDTNRRIAGTGYPGVRSGEPGCLDGACPRGLLTAEQCPPNSNYDNCISQHAEINAIAHADRLRLAGATIYVTRPPCQWCAKVISATGIDHVVFRAADGTVKVEVGVGQHV